jgi:hypothetical protein
VEGGQSKLFYQTLGSITAAEQRLDALTYNALKNTMGTLAQRDIINEDDAAGRNENLRKHCPECLGDCRQLRHQRCGRENQAV